MEGYDAHQIYNELKRWGINKQDQASYFDINIDKIRVHVNCAINGNGDRAILWIEESSDKDIKLRKIIGNIDYSSNWHDNWLTLNNKICRELEMIANN